MFSIGGFTGTFGTNYNEFSNDADTTADHAIIVTGTTTGTMNGMSSVFLLKLDTLLNANNNLIEDLDLSTPNSISNNNLIIYPNPAKDFLHIDGIQKNENIYLFNSTGKLISIKKMKNKSISIINLKSGVYYISTKQNNKKAKCFIKL